MPRGFGVLACRIAIGLGGAVFAALALLPGLVACLLVLLDMGTQSVLGLSGMLFQLATGPGGVGGSGGGLPRYAGIDRAVLDTAVGSALARAVPGIVLVALSTRPRAGSALGRAAFVLSVACLVLAVSTPERIAACVALAGSTPGLRPRR